MACCVVTAYAIMRMLEIYHAIDERFSLFSVKSRALQQGGAVTKSDITLTTCRLTVTGMTCTGCSSSIVDALNSMPGVSRAQVSHALAIAVVTYDAHLVGVDMLISKVDELGFDTCPAQRRSTWRSSFDGAESIRREDIHHWRTSLLLSLGANIVLLIILSRPTSNISRTFTSTSKAFEFLLSTFSVLFCAARVHKEALLALRGLRGHMSLLSSIALVAGFSQPLAQFAFTTTTPSELSFNGVAFLTTVILGGRLLKALVSRRSLAAITTLVSSMPTKAFLMRSHDLEANWFENTCEVPADILEVGDWAVVRPGDVVPSDCSIVRGNSDILETNVTGEILPKYKEPGDLLFAGSTNQSAPIVIEVCSAGSDTWLEKTLGLVVSADSEKDGAQDLISRLTENFVQIVLGAAVLDLFVSRFLARSTWVESFQSMLAILLGACPCALGLSIPSCSMIAISLCSRAKISLVAGSSQIRVAAGIRNVLFDKTGTLTVGHLHVEEARVSEFWKTSEEQQINFWALVTSLELQTTHPIALVVTREAKKRFPSLRTSQVRDVRQEPGLGIQGMVRSNDTWLHVAIGNRRFNESCGVSCEDGSSEGGSMDQTISVFVSINRAFAATLILSDKLRADARWTIRVLEQLGIQSGIVTGASRESALAVAKELEIDPEWVWAEILPDEKASIIKSIKGRHGPTAVVGDNLNDLPALSAASFSLFMSESTNLSSFAGADVIIAPSSKTDDLIRIPWLFQLTRVTRRCMRQNSGWAVFYNLTAMTLSSGILGALHPMLKHSPFTASVGMSLSSLLILANSMRLEQWRSDSIYV